MPWYYAGPQATPIGPVTLDELHAARVSGVVTPDTYVLEHNGQPGGAGAWQRYSDVFPVGTSLPPLPTAHLPPPPPPVGVATTPVAHPLFPSATYAPAPPQYQQPIPHGAPHAAPHAYYPIRRTNAWCAWGFGLGLAGFVLSFMCIGLVFSAPALVICILGLAQVQRHPEQAGKGLAIAGAVLSVLGLLISLGVLAWSLPMAIKGYEQAMSQQTSE